MQFTAQQIAAIIQGKIEGKPDATISHVAKIEEAADGALSFVANPKYEEYLYDSKASIIIVNDALVLEKPVDTTLIRVKDAYSSFALLLEKYNEIKAKEGKTGIDNTAYVSPTATIGKDVYIGAMAYIGDHVQVADGARIYPGCYLGDEASVGAHTTLFAGVKVYDTCKIGAHVIIHSGTVIGSDGNYTGTDEIIHFLISSMKGFCRGFSFLFRQTVNRVGGEDYFVQLAVLHHTAQTGKYFVAVPAPFFDRSKYIHIVQHTELFQVERGGLKVL